MFKELRKQKIVIHNKPIKSVSTLILFALLALTAHAHALAQYSQKMAQLDASNHVMSNSIVQSEPGHVLIFVSSSMPTISLIQWFSQAQRIGAPIILRGFIHNSLPETKAWLKLLLEQSKTMNGIEINPVAFEAYGITQVPAVVVTTGRYQCYTNDNCQTPPFDVTYGNTSLAQALTVIAEKGDAGNRMAKQTLATLKAVNP